MKTKTAYSNYHAIVVDNGSADGSVNMVRQSFPWAEVISLDKNFGFAIGNNKGIVYAQQKFAPQYVLLLNNDTEIIQSDWLSRMVAMAEAAGDIGIVGCKLVYPDGKTQFIGTKITPKGFIWLNPKSESTLPEVFDADAVLGACFLIKKAVLDKIGLLDVGFSPFVHEESDFCARARKAGYRTVLVQTVKVVHYWKASVSRINQEFVETVVRKNLIRFMLLNFPAKWLLKRVPVEIRIFFGCFVARNEGKGKLPIRLRTGRDLLVRLNVNVHGWLCNLMNLREIAAKRENRTLNLSAVE